MNDIVQCKYCGIPTRMVHTKLCDGCWELERRLERRLEQADPAIVKQMLDKAPWNTELLEASVQAFGALVSSHACPDSVVGQAKDRLRAILIHLKRF